jgi:hypothetical protein
LFSIHPYSDWRTEDRAGEVGANGNPPFDVYTQLNTTKNTLSLPLVVGEFTSNAVSGIVYNTRRVMEICAQLGMGFLGWAWNNNNPSQLDMVPGTNWQYNSDADLTAWGNLIVNDSAYGLKASAVQASVFRTPIAGDANMNGVVDSADFTMLALSFNKSGGQTWATGDFSDDRIVNALDFSTLATHFGAVASRPLAFAQTSANLFASSATNRLAELIG